MYSERSLDRLAAFADAIVAIAITLLILPLVDAAGELGETTAWEFLKLNQTTLLSFAISFVVIAAYWMRQHGTFEDLKGYNRSFRYAVMVWILTIVFLPFPTEMIASADSRDTSANVLYIGTLLASSLASLWQSAVIDRHPEMVREDAQRKDFDPFRAGFAVALMFGALVVAAAFPSIGLWALLVMLIPNFSRRLKPSES